ncbi:protein phosphatase 2 (formerly 2A), regulatory subunit B [Trypanosoma rangeli]|uniref:Protein phosphatase 2 (Formerly 2A), regulatory subunit B n=1 Tax=Trypanosoma rangeli TaxID=5698 RepID=A0A3R7KFZ2_TRYRA|nr:protein phosphatase 2 (formerly 2A), regulatory subunit B [Trypanosoma rangeli]RNF06999.1 protein phosphatase 2 (formerly 2A), regulatory subunit B [Trypanosoma rangeli]|eukprot:RNF06999.1 protein phosphatase 2 (formerly 2A), regulatory subunit B [Trypanosoma rangeli]
MPVLDATEEAHQALIKVFRCAAEKELSQTDKDAESWDCEVARINAEAQKAWSEQKTPFIPAMYLRRRDPSAEKALQLLRITSKAFELNLRFREIEQLDEMHAKLWELLSADKTRMTITVTEYMKILGKFKAWQEERFESTPKSSPRREVSVRSSQQECLDDATPLGDVVYLASVMQPRPSVQLYLSCPRSPAGGVEVVHIYQRFAKQVFLVKCEAELIMWDTNNDGCLVEEEMESYVRDLVPRIEVLREITEEMLPFYCCAVSRRIFWGLDPGSRGFIRIDALLQNPVMDEWVSLQLMREEQPRNWFSAAITSNLYDKFLYLDTSNRGTLNADDMKRYKKGLPTVMDDGLPPGVGPLSSLFIDRFFETNVTMAKAELDFRKFVDFVVAVEFLPSCQKPLFFWNILDIEGSGYLKPVHVNHFFRETHAKLVAAGLEVPSRETVVQEAFDLISTAEPLCISREEFINAPQAGLFVALLIDCLSFWTYENREQR